MFQSGADPIRFPSMKWTDYLMKDVTLQQQHNVNISGGNQKVKYFISAGMFTQDGIFEEFDRPYDYGYQYQRFNYRTNLDINVTKTTQVSFNISGKVDESCKPHTGQSSDQMIREMYWASPFSSAGMVDGRYIVTSICRVGQLCGRHPEAAGRDSRCAAYRDQLPDGLCHESARCIPI